MPQKKWIGHHGQQKSPKCSTWMQSQKGQNNLCSFPRQTIQYYIHILVYNNFKNVLSKSSIYTTGAGWGTEECEESLGLTLY